MFVCVLMLYPHPGWHLQVVLMYTSSYPLVVAIKSSASVKLPKDERLATVASSSSGAVGVAEGLSAAEGTGTSVHWGKVCKGQKNDYRLRNIKNDFFILGVLGIVDV